MTRRVSVALLGAAALAALAACGGGALDDEAADAAAGRKQGWFYNGFSEHPRTAFTVAEAWAWRTRDEHGGVIQVWLSGKALDADSRSALQAWTRSAGDNAPAPQSLGIPGVLLRLDERGRTDGRMTEFCPLREAEVQCLGMSGVGALVISELRPERIAGSFYTYDQDAQQTYVSHFATTLLDLAPDLAWPEGLEWTGPGGGAPGRAFLKRNQAALEGDLEGVKSRSMPDMVAFLTQSSGQIDLAKLAVQTPEVLSASVLGDEATVFVRAAGNTILRADMQRSEGRWRVRSTRQ